MLRSIEESALSGRVAASNWRTALVGWDASGWSFTGRDTRAFRQFQTDALTSIPSPALARNFLRGPQILLIALELATSFTVFGYMTITKALHKSVPAQFARKVSRKFIVSIGPATVASTALAILRLPSMLQQYSNARDMLEILAGEPCGRAGYIVGQAHHVLNAYSGFVPYGHAAADWKADQETCAEVEKLVGEALAKRRELIAEEEAIR